MGEILCECGCGRPAPIAKRTDTAKGWVQGRPLRFIRGHATRRDERWRIEDRGFSSPCWIWLLRIDQNGYGRVRQGAKSSVMAHVVTWEAQNGPKPKDKQLDHLCRVRSCVNPDHLEPVTQTENVRRGNRAKLDLPTARKIRTSDGSYAQIAKRFGVCKATVTHIKTGRYWKEP